VVCTQMGPFEKLEGASNKGRATALQRVLVPWLISTHGLGYKTARQGIVMEMVEAIIDQEDLLDLGEPCHDVKQKYSIGFNTVVKSAKKAAGLLIVIHYLCIALL
jgi:hypothetical protein